MSGLLRFFPLLALFTAACAAVPSPAPLPPPGAPVSVLGAGPLVLPGNLSVDGLDVGGLSDLVHLGGDSWLAVVDNQEKTPARVVELGFTVTENGPVPPRGRPNRVPRRTIRLEGFDGESLDAEGLVRTLEGTLLVSSERGPAIFEFSPEGRLLRELSVPAVFRAAEGRGVRKNEGFESLTLAPDGRTLWTANERALAQDAPENKDRPSPVRLLRYARRGEGFVPAAQLAYQVEAIQPPPPAKGFATRGLVDLLALPGGGLLALEREYVEGRGMEVQLFQVTLEGATDVSNLDSLAVEIWTPVRKELLFDFAGAGFTPDNLEGIAFGPDLPGGSRTLVLVSDDNFDRLQQTQIVVLRYSATRGGS